MLENKIALVTGASRGIGRAIAIELAKQGADVVVNYSKDKQGAVAVVEEIRKLGRDSIAIKADVSDFEDVGKMMSTIKTKFKKIDILINNAGITKDRSLRKMAEYEWSEVIDVNLNSIYNVTKQALPLMQRNSRIISISSIVGVYGNFGQTNYAASKAGIIGFTKSLAKEVGRLGITVNAVAPGFIESELTKRIPYIRKKIIMWAIPLKRTGLPEEVAYAVAFLASNEADYLTGQVININGGLAI